MPNEQNQNIVRSPPWTIVVGAIFGGVTLAAFFAFAFVAGFNPSFICNSALLLGAAFGLGSGLSAAFLGGSAAAEGKLGKVAQDNSLAFSLGGGVAFLIVCFSMFQLFAPSECASEPLTISDLQVINPSSLSRNPTPDSPRRLTSINFLNTSTPIKVTDGDDFRVPIVALVENYTANQRGVVEINAGYTVWEGDKLASSGAVPPLVGKDAWKERMLVVNSGGSERLLNSFREARMTIGPETIPVLFLLGCWGAAGNGAHEYRLQIQVSDGRSSDTREVSLNLDMQDDVGSVCPIS